MDYIRLHGIHHPTFPTMKNDTPRDPGRFPNSNWGWHRYYVNRYEKHRSQEALYLAMLYYLFYLAFGDERIPA